MRNDTIQKIIDIFYRDYPTASDETYEFFHDVLNVLRNVKSEWVSVKDRLPEEWVSICDDLPIEGTTVLILDKLGRLYFDKWNGNGWKLSKRGTIEFWINIPEPPKE